EELVLAGFIGEVSNQLAVGRPRRITLHDAGSVRQVANVALLTGRSEDFAVALKHCAGAAWGKTPLGNFLFDLLEVRTNVGQMGCYSPCALFGFAWGKIEEFERPELLIKNCAGTRRGRLDVSAIRGHNLLHFPRLHIVGPQAENAAAIGEKINFVSDPH